MHTWLPCFQPCVECGARVAVSAAEDPATLDSTPSTRPRDLAMVTTTRHAMHWLWLIYSNTVKSFFGTKLCGLTKMDMSVNTWIHGFPIIYSTLLKWKNISLGFKFVDCPFHKIHKLRRCSHVYAHVIRTRHPHTPSASVICTGCSHVYASFIRQICWI